MSEVRWIKIVTDVFDDDKIKMIESMPESDTIIVIWFKVLCLAGKQNCGGFLMFTDKIAYTDEMLATVFRRPINTVRLALDVFEKFGMIERSDVGTIHVKNWDKHQNADALDRIRESGRKRVAAYRERKALAEKNEEVCKDSTRIDEDGKGCNVTERYNVTLCNDVDIDIEREEERDVEVECKKEILKKDEELADRFEEFWKVYPRHINKKGAFKNFVKKVTDGYSPELLIACAKGYAEECKRLKVEERYVMHPTTFMGKEARFLDYKPAKEEEITDEWW